MGNITQLHQGSLNGLRRQTNECLENAYRKGYEDGKKEPREIKAVNVEDTNEYEIGYKTGYDKGYYDGYEKGKLDGLEEFENLFINEYDYEQFFKDTYGTKDPDYNLYDLVAKYGAKKVVDDFKKWEEEKKKAEKEIRIGDEVKSVYDDKLIGIITKVDCKHDSIRILFSDGSGGMISMDPKDYKRTGRNFSAEIEQLLGKLKGEE